MRRFAVFAGVLVVALAGAGVLALRSQGTTGGRIVARFPSYGLSLRYPATWTRVDWCLPGLHVMPIAVLTATQPGPKCDPHAEDVVWPPAAQLGADGVAVALSANAIFPGAKMVWNTRIGGRRAYVPKPVYGRRYDTALACPTGVRREYRSAFVRRPAGANEMLAVAAVICGPDLSAGETAVRHVLASIRLG